MAVLSYLDSQKNVPMTREESGVFLDCCLLEKTKDTDFTKEVAEEIGFSGKVLWSRLKACSPEVKLNLPLAVFLCYLSKGIPGEVVMWAYTCNRLYNKLRRKLTINDITMQFPMGFPDEAERHRLWDAQKADLHNMEGDNMVDRPEPWILDEIQ